MKTLLFRLAIWFAGSRIFLLIVAGLSLRFVPKGPFPAKTQALEWFNHWDAMWYLSIAQNGYSYDLHAPSNVNFFPLYPILMHLLGWVVSDLRLAGYLLSNGLLFASCLLLWKLVIRDYGSRALADRSVLFLLLCPVTVFYSSIYTESLFLFLLLTVAYFAGEHRWLAAGGGGFLAALTRPPGILVTVLIATEYGTRFLSGRETVRDGRRFAWAEAVRVLVALVLPEIGLGLYALYLHARFGDSLAFVHSQAHFNPRSYWFGNALSAGAGFRVHMIWFCGVMLIGFGLAALGIVFRLRPSHLALTFALLFIYCSTNTPSPLPRYFSVVFPFYIIAAEICVRQPRLERWLFGASAALAAFAVVLFVDGYGIS